MILLLIALLIYPIEPLPPADWNIVRYRVRCERGEPCSTVRGHDWEFWNYTDTEGTTVLFEWDKGKTKVTVKTIREEVNDEPSKIERAR